MKSGLRVSEEDDGLWCWDVSHAVEKEPRDDIFR